MQCTTPVPPVVPRVHRSADLFTPIPDGKSRCVHGLDFTGQPIGAPLKGHTGGWALRFWSGPNNLGQGPLLKAHTKHDHLWTVRALAQQATARSFMSVIRVQAVTGDSVFDLPLIANFNPIAS